MSVNKPRLGLESLEAREVPAIVFVGGWGSSMYQYAHNDPAADGLPKPPVVDLTLNQKLEVQASSVTDLVLDPFNPDRAADDVVVDGRVITAENYDSAAAAADYSAVAFVGGRGASASQSGPGSLGVEVHTVGHAIEVRRGEVVDLLVTSIQTQRDAAPLPVLMVIADRQDFSPIGGGGDDVLIGGMGVDDTAASGYIRIKKLNSGG